MNLFDHRLMALLTYLSRRQAWLSPTQISRDFRYDDRTLTVRTIHRWFSLLRGEGRFEYYPYPMASQMGLQEFLVWIRGLRNPEVLAIQPFGSWFSVDVGMGDTVPFISQGYWIPGTAMAAFRGYWQSAKDLDLIEDFEVFPVQNTYHFFSPFEQVIREDGTAHIREPIDNGYFEDLARRRLRETHEVRLGELLQTSPLLIPLVFEHLWTRSSSRQVWEAFRAKGLGRIKRYAKGRHARALSKPGSALRLLQRQWGRLLANFDEIFLQPRITVSWPSQGHYMIAVLIFDAGNADRMLTAVRRVSERSVWTIMRPGLPPDTRCWLSCVIPENQLLPLVDVVREFHSARQPPTIAIRDPYRNSALFDPRFCTVDWTMFDPSEPDWRFPADTFMERLKVLRSWVAEPETPLLGH